MNTRRQIQLLQVICTFVVLATCVGVFATGAWAFNTQTFRTPTETLEMGTFSVCVDRMEPDENGTYNLNEGKYSIILHAYGNMPSLVLTSWTPDGEEAQQYIVWLDPTCEDTSYIEIPVSTYKFMTLTLTPVQECTEEVDELPDQIVVAAPPAPVVVTNEVPENPQKSEQTSEEETEETEKTSSETTPSEEDTTSTDESTSEVVEPQEPATVEENTVEENTVDENTVESGAENEVVTDEAAAESEGESDGESSVQTPPEESEEPLITESETTSGESIE